MEQAIIVSDKYAALAKAMLLALKDDPADYSAPTVNFPDTPQAVRDAQHALLKALYDDGHITPEQSESSYVEPGCVEHNIVHVHVCNFNHDMHWLGIDPDTGEIEML